MATKKAEQTAPTVKPSWAQVFVSAVDMLKDEPIIRKIQVRDVYVRGIPGHNSASSGNLNRAVLANVIPCNRILSVKLDPNEHRTLGNGRGRPEHLSWIDTLHKQILVCEDMLDPKNMSIFSSNILTLRESKEISSRYNTLLGDFESAGYVVKRVKGFIDLLDSVASAPLFDSWKIGIPQSERNGTDAKNSNVPF